ncbi:MAG: exosortase/archaeosortase family protein [Chthoniobacterales bacterium]
MTGTTQAPASARPAPVISAGWLLILAGLIWLPACMRYSIEWSLNAQYYYGWAVPFLAAYLAYERLANCPPASPPENPLLPILVIAFFALPHPFVRIVSEANSDWRLMVWLMGLSAGAICLGLFYLAGGRGWLVHFAFPVLFMATAIPWPSSMETLLVQGMMRTNAQISAGFVTVFAHIPAMAEGNTIRLPGGASLGVNEACSGIRSLQSTLMASIFLGGLYQLPIFARVVLALLGVAIAFLLNIVRTVFLSWEGATHGIAATEKWHDSAGFAILGVVLVLLWLISRFLEKRYGAPPAQRPTAEAS